MGKSRIGERIRQVKESIASAETALAIQHARLSELLAITGSRKTPRRKAKPEAPPQEGA